MAAIDVIFEQQRNVKKKKKPTCSIPNEKMKNPNWKNVYTNRKYETGRKLKMKANKEQGNENYYYCIW